MSKNPITFIKRTFTDREALLKEDTPVETLTLATFLYVLIYYFISILIVIGMYIYGPISNKGEEIYLLLLSLPSEAHLIIFDFSIKVIAVIGVVSGITFYIFNNRIENKLPYKKYVETFIKILFPYATITHILNFVFFFLILPIGIKATSSDDNFLLLISSSLTWGGLALSVILSIVGLIKYINHIKKIVEES